MKKDRRFPSKLNIARMALSFFIAVALFVHAPLEAEAKAYNNNGLSLSALSSQFNIALDGTNEMDGTSLYGSYEGDFTLSFRLTSTRPYMSGLLVVPVHLYLAGDVESVNVSLSTSSLPQEFSVAPVGTLAAQVSPVGPAKMDFSLYINTMGYYFSGFLDFSVTFHVQASSYPKDYLLSALYGSFTVYTHKIQNFYVTYDSLSDMGMPLASIYNAIGLCSTYISNVFTAVQNNTTSTATWLEALVKHADSNSKAEIKAVDAAKQALVNELQQLKLSGTSNADEIMHGYDKSEQDSDNQRFEDSRAELQEQEDSLFESASQGFGSLDMSEYSFGRFTAMLGALSFVSGFLQSCYVKMGDFGAIVTVGMVVMIATKVIGVYRFSTGGDG